MNKKVYFDFLKQKLPKDKYRTRFLEELEEHFEDALYAETFKENAAEERALERLGDPDQTLFYYKKLMSKHSSVYTYLEALFFGVLSTPFYLSLFVANSVTESTEVLFLKVLAFFLSASGLWALFYVFYHFIFSKLKPLNELLSPRGKLASFIACMAPAYLGALALTFNFYFTDYQDHYFPFVILAYLVIGLTAAWKSYVYTFKKPWSVSNEKTNYLLTLLLFALLIFTEVGEVIAYFMKVIWVIIFYGFNANVIWAIWSSGLAVLALGIFSLVSLLRWGKARKAAFPLVKVLILMSSIYALFIPTSGLAVVEELEWNKPHVELVQTFEKEQTGPFYLWSQKFRRDDGPIIDYSISYRGDGFFVHIQNIADYEVKVSSLDEFSVKKLSSDPTEVYPPSNSILHEDLTCVLSDLAAESHEGIAEPPILGGETDCKELYYGDELIFSNPSGQWFMLQNAVFSPGQEWLLLEFNDVMEDPTSLYLVEL
ncbi:MAG: hypothetical protein AAB383_00475 [Patescibacteria group bacterium]